MESRTLFLGLDAVDVTLVEQLAAAGELPAFARLLTSGRRASLVNECGTYVGSVWPTLATGVGVARHGFYTGVRLEEGGYEYRREGVRAPGLWEAVAAAGRPVAVFDVPFFAAVEGLRGSQLVEWSCHDRYWGPSSWPPDLIAQVDAAVGPHPLAAATSPHDRFAPCDWIHRDEGQRTAVQLRAVADDLLLGLDRKAAAVGHVLRREPWQLAFDVVAEGHCGGHHLWHTHDPAAPHHVPALAAELGDLVVEVYRGIDRLLASHLALLDPDDTTYVAFSHGMQPHHDGTLLFDELLWRLEQRYLGLEAPWTDDADEPRRRLGRPATPLLDRLDDVRGRRRGIRQAREASGGPTELTPLPPRAERSWFAVDNNTVSGAIRMNVIGRDHLGRIGRTHEQHARRWLAARLLEIANLDTGEPCVAAVLDPRSPGDGLPDLFVEWRRDTPVERVWSADVGRMHVPYTGIRTGDHRLPGELVAVGPGIVPGRRPAALSIDVAPTVAASVGVHLVGVDGGVLDDLLPGSGRRTADRRRQQDVQRALEHPRLPRPRVDDEVAALRRDVFELREQVRGLLGAHHETWHLAQRAAHEGYTALSLLATTAWVQAQPPPDNLVISVVLPTRNRLPLLQRAVGSILAQSHPDVDLVVVDDASEDGTWAWLSTQPDPRLRPVRNDVRLGEAGSRNVALDLVRGEVITYLDDDNWFHPGWLAAVAWLFVSHPEVRAAYGARIVDDELRHHRTGDGGLPWLQLNGWDPAVQLERSLVDMNVFAHRPSDVRFDAGIEVMSDWDVINALSVGTTPLRFPVVAAFYTTDALDRQSDLPPDVVQRDYARVRDRWSS